jgi:hypothetical protein
MEKQGGLLADRPHLIAAGEMLNGGLSIPLAPVGERWRRMRRFVVRDPSKLGHNLTFNVTQSTSYAFPA